jgi:hypothetical protein
MKNLVIIARVEGEPVTKVAAYRESDGFCYTAVELVGLEGDNPNKSAVARLADPVKLGRSARVTKKPRVAFHPNMVVEADL